MASHDQSHAYKAQDGTGERVQRDAKADGITMDVIIDKTCETAQAAKEKHQSAAMNEIKDKTAETVEAAKEKAKEALGMAKDDEKDPGLYYDVDTKTAYKY